MHISIATSTGKTINLEVDSVDSVHQIKQKIHVLEGIPSDQQKLLYDGKQLEDLQAIIAESKVEKEFLITLSKVNEINLQIRSIGEASFTVQAEPTDTIASLKAKIQRIKGLADANDYILSFKGKKLEKEHLTLSSANLKDKSVLLLVRKNSSKANLSVYATALKNSLNDIGHQTSVGSIPSSDYGSKSYQELGHYSSPDLIASSHIDININNNNNINIKNISAQNNNNNNNRHIIEEENEVVVQEVQKDTSKCWKCSKKIGIYGFQCRCKYHFCDKHRYNDRHNCTFDYTEFQRSHLAVRLEKCVERKLEEI